MTTETNQKILDKIDELIAAIGQKDYDAFRATMQRASVLFGNFARFSEQFAAISREQLAALVDKTPEVEQEHQLRLLCELHDFLPALGALLMEGATRVFPRSQGGRPSAFKDRESQRRACNMVLAYIAKGNTEAQAKNRVAQKLGVSDQAMNSVWKKRTVIAEQSVEEFLLEKFNSFCANSTTDNRSKDNEAGEIKE